MMQFVDITKDHREHVVVSAPGDTVLFVYNVSKKISIDITVSGARVFVYGVFVGVGSDTFELRTVQRHIAPKSESNVLVKSSLNDESQFMYEGLIRIEKEAQHTSAYQKNQNIVLSKNAQVSARPFLEILANDVFCTHGATTGGINDEHVMYIQSRGIDENRAKNLITVGFIEDVFEQLKQHGIVDEVAQYKKDAHQKIYA